MPQTLSILSLEEQLNEAYAIRGQNLPRGIQLAEAVLKEASELNEPNTISRAHNILSLFNVIQCRFDEALDHANKALSIFSKLNYSKGIADAYYNIGSVHYRRDNYHFGLEFMLKSLKLYKELSDHHNIARVNKSMGTIYEYFGDYTSAEAAYQNCIASSRLVNDKNSESNAYNPLSGLLIKRGDIKQAEEMVMRSLELKKETVDRRGYGFAIYALGKVNLAKRKYKAALLNFEEAESIHLEFGDQLGRCMTLSKVSDAYFHLGDLQAAYKAALGALEIASENRIEFIRFKAFHRLYVISKERKQQSEAFRYLEQYISAKETVINTHTHNVIQGYTAINKIEALEKEASIQKEKTTIIEKKNDELDTFFYRVSHDLKGPISSLLGLHNLAKLEVKDETSLQYFDLLNGQVLRINNIVLGLIDLINLRNERHKSRIDFNQLVDDCINSCFYLEKFSSVKIIKEIEPDIRFESEWAIINTILQNLIDNAIKYSRPYASSFVKIKVSEANNHVIIVVQDNGEGIPETLQSNIFNMFVRGSSRQNGSGLGLYILHRAVERLNGVIQLESEYNKGSTFTVKLPIAQ